MDTFSFCWQCVLKVLLMLTIANGAPVLARGLLDTRFAWPVDFGRFLPDGQPLFGFSKTWRGLAASVLATSMLAPLFGLTMITGALFGLLAMAGDLGASFIKRRMGYRESSRFRVVDVVPEALLPILVLQDRLELTILEGSITVVLFFIVEALLSPILFRLHIRNRPY